MNITSAIKERRVALNLTQEDLAEMSGVSLATIKDMERGVGNPSIRIIEKITNVLGMEICVRIKM